MLKNNSNSISAIKVLSNRHRIKILEILFSSKKDLCVNEIAASAGISQSLASHQLSYLSARGVVEGYRKGKTICYKPAKNKFSGKVFKILKVLST